MRTSSLQHIGLILVTGVLTYLSASMAGFLSIDDVAMMKSLYASSYTFKSLFLSGANEYYRPLAVVSYHANAFFTGVDPVFFHWFNVALHLGNAILVYWLALMLPITDEKKEWGALVAALFFLVSPLNSEAVTWVSARPDLLCTFFFLLSLIVMVKHRDDATVSSLACLFLSYLLSLCSKEASIVLAGIAPLFLLVRAKKGPVKDAVALSLVVFAASTVYLFLRFGTRLTVDQGVGSVVKVVTGKGAAASAALDPVGAYGFYLQKLLMPFPLNFTILSFDRLPALAALAFCVGGALYLLRRFESALLPVLIVFLGIVPAILAYIGNIPWVPFGERYLYLPMVGFSLLVSLVINSVPRLPRIVPVACLLLLSILTMQRVSLWCDRVAFWNDALTKSPGFAKSYSALGAAALEDKRYDEAEAYMKKAIAAGSDVSLVWQNLAQVYQERNQWRQYEETMDRAASLSSKPVSVYQSLISGLMEASDGSSHREKMQKSIRYHLLALEKDPSYLDAYYHVGKLYFASGDLPQAKRYLKRYTDSVKGGFFRPFAVKMLQKIEARDHV